MTGPNLLLLLLSAPATAQDCAAPATPADLDAAAAEAEEAFSNLDLDGLNVAATRAEALLPCVQDPLSLETAAAYHRLMGMSAFANQERERVIYEFSAARVSEPGYTMPESLAPAGHPLQAAYAESINLDGGEAETPVPPEGGWVVVAGVRDGQRKIARPTIVQVYEADGSWVETRYIPPGQQMPAWGPPPAAPVSTWRRRAVTAGGAALASGLLVGSAAMAGQRFDQASEQTPMTTWYRVNRGSVVGAAATGGGAIALGFWAYSGWKAEHSDD